MDLIAAMKEEALIFEATREMRESRKADRERIARLEALVREALVGNNMTYGWQQRASAELGITEAPHDAPGL